MRVPLAGGTQETLLSEVGPVLLPFFTTRDACALRLVCREFLAAAREHPWEDGRTAIQGSVAAWRVCFPRARCANVGRRTFFGAEIRVAPVYDADFVHFAGLRELNMAFCTDVTDAAFVHLRGIHSLEMQSCFQLTDAAFTHLAGIQRLGMFNCPRVTDAAFVHLRGLELLSIVYCRQLTDAAFVHLRGVKTVYMQNCGQPAITDAAIAHLRGIRTLVLDDCSQATITGATFASLTGIEALCVRGCSAEVVAAGHALDLPVPAGGLLSLGYACAFYPWPKPRAAPW
jgi:hypothetical protein